MTDMWWFNRLCTFSLQPCQDRGVWRSSKEPDMQWYSCKSSKTATGCYPLTCLKWVESRKRWKGCHTNACLLVCDCIRKLPGPSALSKCAPNTYNLEREEWPSGCGLLTTRFYFCLTDGLSKRSVLDFFFFSVSTHSRPQLPFKAILSLSSPCFKILLECVTML